MYLCSCFGGAVEGGTLGRENTSLEEGEKKKEGREKESRDLQRLKEIKEK